LDYCPQFVFAFIFTSKIEIQELFGEDYFILTDKRNTMFPCHSWWIKDRITLGSISAHGATHQDRNLHSYIVFTENYSNTSQ